MSMLDLMANVDIRCGDVRKELRKLPAESVNCVITSPPYWRLRDYGFEGQLGLEATPQEFIRNLVKVFRQVRRVLRKDGTVWVNMGDSHIHETVQKKSFRRDGADALPKGLPKGFKVKDKALMPHRLAIALQDDGWYLRQDIVWFKQQPQPETVSDRPTTAHEYIFLLSKSARYWYDAEAIEEACSEKTNARSASAKLLRDPAVRDQGGVNIKVRMTTPAGWATDSTARTAVEHSTRRAVRSKQNESAAAGMAGQVLTRNKRSVWPVFTDRMDLKLCTGCKTVYTAQSFEGLKVLGFTLENGTHVTRIECRQCLETEKWLSHFAAFGAQWIEPCVLAGCPPGGTVLDCFAGTGTTLGVAVAHGRKAIGIEGSSDYVHLIPHRVEQVVRRLKNAPAPAPVAKEQLTLTL